MRAPSDRDLLDAWDRGAAGGSPFRGLALLRLARPAWPEERLAATGLGERDDALLEMHRGWLGPALDCMAECPGCGEAIEFAVPVDAVRAAAVDEHPVLEADGRTLRLRMPSTADAIAAAGQGPGAARRELVRRCLLDQPVELSDELVEAAAARLAEADPRADVRLVLTCPECRHGWRPALDVVAYLWAELEAALQRVLLEVHRLASAYGWTEAEVLAVPAGRRRFYLEAVG
ncbi:hypothetical protein ACQP2F_19010 [Actinoplanes sp. CA-030573]|uniref:hypothetical protein n=1 Tax=Actinoplanes sp. CA-030573 TaxID=3239898 RepID=UPI003D94B7AB